MKLQKTLINKIERHIKGRYKGASYALPSEQLSEAQIRQLRGFFDVEVEMIGSTEYVVCRRLKKARRT